MRGDRLASAALGVTALLCAPVAFTQIGAVITLATLSGSSVTMIGASPGGSGPVPTELDAAGRVRVMDGATVNLDGRSARLNLVRGGTIDLCGPARLGLAAGGQSALLLSLSSGSLYLRYPSPVADSLLTPDFRLTTVVPPDQLATVSAAVSLAPNGALCVLNRGSALSLERLANGAQQYVINGDTIVFQPEGGSTTVSSCPCAAPAPAGPAAASGSRAGNAAGELFPSGPALTVNGQSAGEPVPESSIAAMPGGAMPQQAHRNLLVRFWRWILRKRS
ncbi:MAG TPA: hypothetical protein VN709_13200 [Terriglobales bacterium]|nr:hypothetical protein [Terriglobales bacterium]